MARRIPEYNRMALTKAFKSPLKKSLVVVSWIFWESQFKGLAAIPFLTLLSMASTLGQFSSDFSSLKKIPLPRVQVSVIFTRKMDGSDYQNSQQKSKYSRNKGNIASSFFFNFIDFCHRFLSFGVLFNFCYFLFNC